MKSIEKHRGHGVRGVSFCLQIIKETVQILKKS